MFIKSLDRLSAVNVDRTSVFYINTFDNSVNADVTKIAEFDTRAEAESYLDDLLVRLNAKKMPPLPRKKHLDKKKVFEKFKDALLNSVPDALAHFEVELKDSDLDEGEKEYWLALSNDIAKGIDDIIEAVEETVDEEEISEKW